MKVKEWRERIAKLRTSLKDETDLMEINQQRGMTKFTPDDYALVQKMREASERPLRMLETELANRDPEAEIEQTEEEKFARIEAGVNTGRELILNALSGGKSGQA